MYAIRHKVSIKRMFCLFAVPVVILVIIKAKAYAGYSDMMSLNMRNIVPEINLPLLCPDSTQMSRTRLFIGYGAPFSFGV
jgi:hypothetical protein